MSEAVVLDRCQTRSEGLTEAEARERLARGGRNRVEPPGAPPGLAPPWDRLRSAVPPVLVLAGGLAWLTGRPTEAAGILAVLVLNLVFGLLLELRAGSAPGGREGSGEASVLREGRWRRILSEELVPGDIVRVVDAERVPADLRLLEARDARVDEGALTGSGAPVGKGLAPLPPPEAQLGGRTSMLYAGSVMVAGGAKGVVVATGPDTEAARIHRTDAPAGAPSSVRDELRRLEYRLIGFAGAVALVAGSVGLLRGLGVGGLGELGLGLALAALPVALPAAAALALAAGVGRMARRHASARRIDAVGALAGVSVACIDKTGLLTTGGMTAVRIVTAGLDAPPPGRGGSATPALPGNVGAEPPDGKAPSGELAPLLKAAALVARPPSPEGSTRRDPADAALLTLVRQGGLDAEGLREKAPRVAEFPFSPEAGASASFHREGGVVRGYVKGTPGTVLRLSASVWGAAGPEPLSPDRRARLEARNREMADEGLRVIALALAPEPKNADTLPPDLVFLGLVALHDPLAPGAPETIRSLRGAGVRTVLLTGDQTPTALAVARSAGLPARADAILTGEELASLDDAGLRRAAGGLGVVGRAGPEAKGRIVGALRAVGETVAVVGDGVNDTAALREADVALVPASRGTADARGAADVILDDDCLATAAAAMEEGRIVVDNLGRILIYLFSCSVAQLVVVGALGAAGLPLPLSPLQILWLNLAGVLLPALALAWEPGEPLVMWRAPRRPEDGLVPRRAWARLAFSALLLAGVTMAAYLLAHGSAPTPRARTAAFATLALAQLLLVWNVRGRNPGLPGAGLLGNRWLLHAVAATVTLDLAALYWPPLSRTLGTVPPGLGDWAVVLPLAAIPVAAGVLVREPAVEEDEG